MLNRKLILLGYSGHGLVVADAALQQGLNLKFYTEKQAISSNPFSLEYLGFEGDDDFKYWQDEVDFALGIGSNKIRRKVAELILSKNKKILNIIHPNSSISEVSKMGIGNFISRNVSVNPLAMIGDYCILNTGSIVEHECVVGNAVHIAPGAVLAGGVQVGDNSFIGANAVITQGIKIGDNVTIGAGAVVIRDVLANKKVVGNPAKEI